MEGLSRKAGAPIGSLPGLPHGCCGCPAVVAEDREAVAPGIHA